MGTSWNSMRAGVRMAFSIPEPVTRRPTLVPSRRSCALPVSNANVCGDPIEARRERIAKSQAREDTVALRTQSLQEDRSTITATMHCRRQCKAHRVFRREGDHPLETNRLLDASRAGSGEQRHGEYPYQRADDCTPSADRAASGLNVCGASARTSPPGRTRGFSCLRSTQTRTIQPAAPSEAAFVRNTSKCNVSDLVPTLPT